MNSFRDVSDVFPAFLSAFLLEFQAKIILCLIVFPWLPQEFISEDTTIPPEFLPWFIPRAIHLSSKIDLLL